VGAELLQITDRTGTVTVGKEADLIAVPDNPLEDIRAVQDVVLVISNGVIVLNRLPFQKE
jgi:imidazolonepropionase-like amidohydrolase